MLKQCYEFINQEENFPKENFILVRADISTRLPFASSSVDAVHAGAALHCWPSPSAAISNAAHHMKERSSKPISLWYIGKILLAFVFIFVMGAIFSLALENLPRLILFINSSM
ncbi:hypothetical protein ACSBR1_020831 [Camellia fascicularis]